MTHRAKKTQKKRLACITVLALTANITSTFALTEQQISAYVKAEITQCASNLLSNSNATTKQANIACSRIVADLQPVARPCYDLPAQNFNACFQPRYAKVNNCVRNKKGTVLQKFETCIRQDFVV